MLCGTLFVIGPPASVTNIARRIEQNRRSNPFLRAIKIIAHTGFLRELEESEDSLFTKDVLSISCGGTDRCTAVLKKS
jgi:hypothetical protein